MFSKGKPGDIKYLTTDVDNIYIDKYMPAAPGDFVKVYLLGLMSVSGDSSMSFEKMAEKLTIPVERVIEAFDYWSEIGAVVKTQNYDGSYDIQYVDLRGYEFGVSKQEENVFGSAEASDESQPKNSLRNPEVRELLSDVENILGRTLTDREIKTIPDWINEGITGDTIISAYEYCMENEKTGIAYVSKVVHGWHEEGLDRREKIEDFLNGKSERQGIYKKILQSLGLFRNPTDAEKRMIDGWLDDMKFDISRIMDACERSGFNQNPNLRYVNKVLENWKKDAEKMGRDINQKAVISQADWEGFYKHLRDKAESEARARKKKVYTLIPRVSEIDIEINGLRSRISQGILGGVPKQDMEEFKRRISVLSEERAFLLTENNFTLDYTDIKYSCDKCSDTGFDENGQRCSCARDRIGEVELWQRNLL